LEFSFDRSKDSPLNNNRTEAPKASPVPEPQGVRAGPDLNSVDPTTIANDRLRKAIERNRAKQSNRSFTPNQEQSARVMPQTKTMHSPTQAEKSENYQQESFINQEEQSHQAHQENVNDNFQEGRTSTVVSRRTVAKPDDTEFVPVKRSSRKVANQVSYATGSSKKKAKAIDPKISLYFVRGCWLFCGVMILRLIFAAGGVTDFYSQKATVNEKNEELNSIKKENMQLVREIERMKIDTSFQKKLVRDNLGFIANDEFLVLFPKD
jgi:cell division protein FtsB